MSAQSSDPDDQPDRPEQPDRPSRPARRAGLAAVPLDLGGQLTFEEIPGQELLHGTAGMVPGPRWRRLLDDTGIQDRYRAKIYRRGPDQCWPWLGAISSTGHGKLHAARTETGEATITVSAHVYGWQLAHGPIRPGPGQDLVVGHSCDEAACQNMTHCALIERRVNGADYFARRHRQSGPLADTRGAQGRAVAVRNAILQALAEHRSPAEIEADIAAVHADGIPALPRLF